MVVTGKINFTDIPPPPPSNYLVCTGNVSRNSSNFKNLSTLQRETLNIVMDYHDSLNSVQSNLPILYVT